MVVVLLVVFVVAMLFALAAALMVLLAFVTAVVPVISFRGHFIRKTAPRLVFKPAGCVDLFLKNKNRSGTPWVHMQTASLYVWLC